MGYLNFVRVLFLTSLAVSACYGARRRWNGQCKVRRLRGNGQCPSDWFIAHFAAIADTVIPAQALAPMPDSGLTFFRNIMRFSEEEIEEVVQDAIEFFNTRYGLDFSQAIPDALGQRTVGNAVFSSFVFSPEAQYTVSINSWLLNGRTQSRCYENRDGGFGVQFTSEAMLFGEYGGAEGKRILPGESIVYGFYNIPVCPQEPIVIQYRSGTPFRFEPVDNFGVINCEVFHRTLGEGTAQGLFRAVPTGEEGMVRLTVRNFFTFPGDTN